MDFLILQLIMYVDSYNSEWMSPSSIGGGITNFLRRGNNPLLSYTLRVDAQ